MTGCRMRTFLCTLISVLEVGKLIRSLLQRMSIIIMSCRTFHSSLYGIDYNSLNFMALASGFASWNASMTDRQKLKVGDILR